MLRRHPRVLSFVSMFVAIVAAHAALDALLPGVPWIVHALLAVAAGLFVEQLVRWGVADRTRRPAEKG